MTRNAIIFDHDGTLVDSIEAVVICTNNIIERAGFQAVSPTEIKKGMAYPTAERFGYHTGVTDRSRLEDMSRDFYLNMHEEGIGHLKLYDGVSEALDALAQNGFALGMVTNNQGLFVRKAAAQLSYAFDFEVILGEENVSRPKPDPSGLLQACAGMGAIPEECWYIGDGKPDFDAARAAGMKCGLVSWGTHSREELAEYGADKLFDRAEEMKDFFMDLK
ncbi:HAD family hydrolase [Spirochaeta isovalerica]|uniref:Phosphoglycolate phosphatase n=1 Tax=Spirochaeta isovalerica TaxID=150 RepID=A0A841R627_9SPIO|nr:HAD family hydrolase [Spirochaeta isovalerica]MBB6480654.1 phosphoglycolate phosphatase [Spirochaeta isovalerica]